MAQSSRRAVIDVGTNSVKLLVADVAGSTVEPVREESTQTRLGQDFYQDHVLRPESIARTAQAVAAFTESARLSDAQSIRVIATSAARDARNSAELVAAIHKAAGLATEIISGEEEARLVFKGVTTDPALASKPLLLLDVGGGSTEFIFGEGAETHFQRSFPLGTVRLIETLPHSDPPTLQELARYRQWLDDFLRKEVRPELSQVTRLETALQAGELLFVGTGGTASILARMEAQAHNYDRQVLEATRLRPERLRWHLANVWSLPLARRKQIVGLPSSRADVILAGAAIFEAIQSHFQLPELHISTRGLRFAALMDQPGAMDHPGTASPPRPVASA